MVKQTKNPLNKRYIREIKSDFLKYAVIFIFMALFVGTMSGFLVCGDSVLSLYEDSHVTQNLEDGHLTFNALPTDTLLDEIQEDNDLKLYPMFYKEVTLKQTDNLLRIYASRKSVNKEQLYKGNLPTKNDEIALDRMYCQNNKLHVGQTITLSNQQYKISGFISLPDYSALYQNNTDMMFDAVNFGVGITNDQGYDRLNERFQSYNYAWLYNNPTNSESKKNERYENLIESLKETLTNYNIENITLLKEPLQVENCLPEYSNQAIQFVGTDGKGDRVTMQVMTYIIMIIIALLFAITSSNTINKESMVIGTLRASGYTKKELIKHYMMLPTMVSLIGCLTGNILGYTVFTKMFETVYYNSYSLPVYKSYFSTDAFIQTTVIPMLLIVVIVVGVLWYKLSSKPITLIRGETKKIHYKQKALRLPKKISFMTRYKIRILLQNIGSYMTLTFGILIAAMLCVFSFMFLPLLDDYANLVVESKLCEYQYIVKNNVEITSKQAEKFCMSVLETTKEDYLTDEVSIFGIEENSQYIHTSLNQDEVVISNALSEKYHLAKGDVITLKEKYNDKTYRFTINNIYRYDGALALFMPRDDYLECFNKENDYFTGYFSNETLTELKQEDLVTIVDETTLKKLTNQMNESFGEFMVVFEILGATIFVLVMFILTKQVLEKNIKSISISKILGFNHYELSQIYLGMTSFVVGFGLLISVPITDVFLRYLMSDYIYKRMTGYLPYIVSNACYIKTFALGIICYMVVVVGMVIKIKDIKKGEVLKNQCL